MLDNREFTSIEIGSNRSFGIVFTIVFAVIGVYPLLSGGVPRAWSLVIGGVLLLVTVLAPRVLAPFNRLWFKFGLVLARIINPVVMLFIYALTILPFGLIFKLIRKDPLNRSFDRNADTYWIRRSPPGPEPQSLTEQF